MKKIALPTIRSALAMLSAAAILAACAPQPPKSVARSETIEASAIVEAIDYSTREVVLRDAQGRQTLVKAGPEVRNLAQVKKGDRVVVRFTEGFAAQVVKPGTGVTGVQAETSMVRAAPGEQPGATIGEQIRTTVKVYEVDPVCEHHRGHRTARLQPPSQGQGSAGNRVHPWPQKRRRGGGDVQRGARHQRRACEVTVSPKPVAHGWSRTDSASFEARRRS